MSMDSSFIKNLLEIRAAALLPVTVTLKDGTTLTGIVAFVDDNAVGLSLTAPSSGLRVVKISSILTAQ